MGIPTTDLLAAVVLGGAALLTLAAAELVRKLGGTSEQARKTAHVGSGLVAASFPYLFESMWTVLALAASFVLVIFTTHRIGTLKGVHGVDRDSLGAFAFPVTIAGLFVLAAGSPALYVIPILVLALADAAAALVGKSYGSVHYHALGERRSFEGTVAFFVVTFVVVHVPLQIYALAPRTDTVLIAAGVAFVAACVEAISVRGLDNVFVPLASWYALDSWLVAPDPNDHWRRLVVMAGAAAIALALRRTRLLTRTGAVGSVLCAYSAWSMGGWAWALPLAAAFAAAVILGLATRPTGQRTPMGLSHLFQACVTAVVVLFIHDRLDPDVGTRSVLYIPYLAAITAGSAVVAGSVALHAKRAIWGPVTLASAAPIVVAAAMAGPEELLGPGGVALAGVAGPGAVLLGIGLLKTAADFRCATCQKSTREPRHCGEPAELQTGHRHWTRQRTRWTAIGMVTLLALLGTRLMAL